MKTHDQYCRECGTSIATGAKNCPNCGHRVFQDAPSGTRLTIDSSRSRQTRSSAFGDVISRIDYQPGNYQIADGFVLDTRTGDVWKYDENSGKFKVVEKEDSLLTSVEKAKTYLDRSEEIDRWVGDWEGKLSEIGDDSQLANIDLQNTLQKQQQIMQMMSNVSKMLHDTAMAVVRKIG